MRTVPRGALAALLAVASAGCSLTIDPNSVPQPASGPTIALSASTLSFSAIQGGASPLAKTVTVTNSGAGILATPTTSISYGTGSGWLAASVTGAGAPYTVTVQADVAGLVPGSYVATVSV